MGSGLAALRRVDFVIDCCANRFGHKGRKADTKVYREEVLIRLLGSLCLLRALCVPKFLSLDAAWEHWGAICASRLQADKVVLQWRSQQVFSLKKRTKFFFFKKKYSFQKRQNPETLESKTIKPWLSEDKNESAIPNESSNETKCTTQSLNKLAHLYCARKKSGENGKWKAE